jgi:hypothetical protein
MVSLLSKLFILNKSIFFNIFLAFNLAVSILIIASPSLALLKIISILALSLNFTFLAVLGGLEVF